MNIDYPFFTVFTVFTVVTFVNAVTLHSLHHSIFIECVTYVRGWMRMLRRAKP